MGCETVNKFDYAGSDIYRFRKEINVSGLTYSDGDTIGGLIIIPDVFGCSGYAYLLNAILYEKKGTGGTLQQAITNIYLINKTFTISDNDAFTLSGLSLTPDDIEFMGNLRGFNTLETDYAKADLLLDIGGTRDQIKNGFPIKWKDENKDTYMILQNKNGGSITFGTNAKLYLSLDFIRH